MIEADRQEAELAPLDNEAHAWIRRLTSGDATTSDAEAFERWHNLSAAHKAAFSNASGLWNAFGVAGQRLRAQAVADVLAGAKAGSSAPGRKIDRRVMIGAALAASAASVGAMIVRPPLELWPSLSELTADFRTATGEQRRISVADDVSIAMNTQTSIALRPAAPDADRIELIAGEAAIALARDGARSLIVEVVGARAIASHANFDIRVSGRGGAVTCLGGELRVECLGSAATLGLRQRVVYDDRGLGEAVTIDPTLASAWHDGLLIFRATPLSEVIEELNRYRPGRIVLMNAELSRSPVNGRFRIDRTDDVLAQIRQAFGARQRTLPGGIVLLG
jgi:transmembrane sensor